MRHPIFRTAFLFALIALAVPARALTLDWDGVSYTPGSTLPHSYDIDPDSAGDDITVQVTANDGAPFQPEIVAPNPMTPAINPSLQGGQPTTENTLCIALDLTSNTQSVTVNVSFSSAYTDGVTNVSFTVFDVDSTNVPGNTYEDQLRSIRGIALDGSLIAPTITTSASNVLTGTGIDQMVTGIATTNDMGAGSETGNVTISFGTNVIKGFTFTYGGGANFADPTYEHIGIHDINFTPVPEINPAWSAAFSCVVAGLLILHHRGKIRK